MNDNIAGWAEIENNERVCGDVFFADIALPWRETLSGRRAHDFHN
jgi:hypothetical protein